MKSQWWNKLPSIPGFNNSCFNCPPISPTLKLTRRIAVGFGFAGVTKDGEVVWSEPANAAWKDLPRLRKFENMARKDPNHDWRAVMDGPLHGETYQRHAKNRWVLVLRSKGFA